MLIEILLITLAALSLIGAGFIWRFWQQANQKINQENQQILNDLNQAQEELNQAKIELAVAKQTIATLEETSLSQTKKLEQTSEQLTATQIEKGKLQAELKEKTDQFAEQQANLKQEFELLANKIFEQKNQKFKEESSASLTQLLAPFHHDMKAFKQQVEKVQQTETEQRLSIKLELENLQKHSQKLSDDAQQLTQALQGQKKSQGNWGEMILERVLETAGLVAERDFVREQSFNTDEGRRRPDVVVNLPGEKHLVIDAKTSLTAYSKFINSDDEAEKASAIKEHISALRDRMKELADKEYFKLPGLQAPEVVVLFVPIESAYSEALKVEPSLLDEAMRMHLLIATPSTLLSSIQIVRQLWRFSEQNKHSAELADRAEKFYNKLNSFLKGMQTLGTQIDRVQATYEGALSQFYSGRGNLIKQAADFKDLGVLVKNELPEELLEMAKLELVHDQPQAIEDKSHE